MIEQLEKIAATHAELTARLASPEVLSDPRRYRETSKALAEIDGVVGLFRRWREVERQLGQARELVAGESDAELRGLATAESATLDAPIEGKRAVTHVRVTERLPGATAIAARLETGRTHQIRLHLAGAGHPVLGDHQHGGELARGFRPRPPRLALHAGVLGFVHPRTGEPVRFEAPLPDDLAGWLTRLRSATP